MKWKNIKQNARKREAIRRKAQHKTGGGKLTAKEQRVADSVLYADIVLKMGASASGNSSRFDSDAAAIVPPAPTKRLSSAIADLSEDSIMSVESNMSSTSKKRKTLETDYTYDNDDDEEGFEVEQHETPLCSTNKRCASRTKSVSNSSDSMPNPAAAKNIRDLRAQTQAQLSEFLSKNGETSDLHAQLLRQQIDRGEKSQQFADFQLRKYEAEAQKAEFELKKAKMDVELTEQLKEIEVQKAQTIANMQIEAQRRQLNL